MINELDIPVTVLGVKDIIVAASPDGILVADKASSPRIKELISGFEQPPMYEERIWEGLGARHHPVNFQLFHPQNYRE
ncbi:hypothetical protein SAMN05443253_107319 [Bacillus sp. OK048]|nr:hypothetical protein SAMN05443253_107319 [Bacillus sp. OK048]